MEINAEKLALALLDWNRKYLRHDSDISHVEVAEVFADHFTVIANGRHYDANYENYIEMVGSKCYRHFVGTILVLVRGCYLCSTYF